MTTDKEKAILTPKEIYDKKKEEKQHKKESKKTITKIKEAPKKWIKPFIITVVVLAIIIGFGSLIGKAPQLPPNSSQGHIEENPEAHILTEKMPDKIQKHMLEHADGEGDPAVLMQYNCTDYTCAEDFITKLEGIIEKYPDNVYLAPNTYDGMLILTAEGRREVLEGYDEAKITKFIENK